MSKSTTCPEDANSTDCLLRLVLEALEERPAADKPDFNWDPLTFAFTVPIALVAALFALVTSYQAVLAAAPGRRKSNRRAIGPWAEKTRSEWNWRDLSRVSIATTPLLRKADLLEAGWADASREAPSPPGTTKDAYRNQVGGASWLALLESAGLGDLHASGAVPVQKTMADYLPSDLMAVPAYMDVGLIIAMTAAMGVQSIRALQSDAGSYPVIVGMGFQFDFRHHPTLGTVGAFTDYEKGDAASPGTQKHSTRRRRQLAWNVMHATGRTSAIRVKHLSPPSSGFLLHGDLDSLKWNLPATQHIPRYEADKYLLHVCHPDPDRVYLCPAMNREDRHHLLWLFCATTPSRFWSNPDMRELRPGDGLAHTQYTDTTIPEVLPGSWAREDESVFPPSIENFQLQDITDVLEGWSLSDERREASSLFYQRSKRVQEYTGVLRRSWEFLHDPDGFLSWFETLELRRKKYFRCLVLLQIHELDRWFGDKSEVACCVATLFNTTVALLDLEYAISEGQFCLGAPGSSGDAPGVCHSHSGPRHIHSDAPTQHRRTLEGVVEFLGYFSDFEVYDAVDTDLNYGNPRAWDITEKHRKDIAILLGDNSLSRRAVLRDLVEVIPRLRAVVDCAYPPYTRDIPRDNNGGQGADGEPRGSHIGHCNEGQDGSGEGRNDSSKGILQDKEPSTDRAEEEDPHAILNRTRGEVCEDAVVWRVLLMGMLFWTAPDCSESLKSGVYDIVLPVI